MKVKRIKDFFKKTSKGLGNMKEQTCSPQQEGWTESVEGKSGPLVVSPWQDWYQDRYLPQTDRPTEKNKIEERKEESRLMENTKMGERGY